MAGSILLIFRGRCAVGAVVLSVISMAAYARAMTWTGALR